MKKLIFIKTISVAINPYFDNTKTEFKVDVLQDYETAKSRVIQILNLYSSEEAENQRRGFKEGGGLHGLSLVVHNRSNVITISVTIKSCDDNFTVITV